MKKIKYLIAGIGALTLFSACLKEYQELNTDVEKTDRANPIEVFTSATRNFNYCSRAWLTGKYGNMVRMQYLVASNGASAGNYIASTADYNPPTFSAPWYSDYYNTQSDGGGFGLRLNYLINSIVPIETNPEQYNDLVAICQILMGYRQWMILDTYGAAPITEAFQAAQENYTPRYDLYQESVDGEPMYKVIDQHLKEAVAALEASDASQANLGDNDFFYGGDVAKWIKAGNTLRVKMAQRLEKRDNAFYNQVINEVLTSKDKIIASHDESLIYWHASNYPNNGDDVNVITSQYVASATLVNFLKEYNDPRLPIMVRPNGFGLNNNNELNDGWWKIFIDEYPNLKLKRTISGSEREVDLSTFANNRYIGQTANPVYGYDQYKSLFIGNYFSNIPYYPVDEESGKKAETPSNMDIRMYSQFEGRFFVENGGLKTRIGERMVEDDKYVIANPSDIHLATPILAYPEACFMYAEIAVKKGGSVAGQDATAWYREGIRAAMEQTATLATRMYVPSQMNETSDNYNPITSDKIDAYLAQPEFQSATLEKIISQQWLALFMQPEEMWATWKRTGLPAFKTGETSTVENGIELGVKPVNGVAYFEEIKGSGNTDLIMPRRNALPTPNSLNLANYNAAIDKLKEDPQYGSDVDRTEGRIWWDAE